MAATVDWRYFHFSAFLLLVNEVLVQSVTVVNGTLGRSVLLPCSTSQETQTVFWRYNNSITVYDIISGKVDFDDQHTLYKGRVESFQTEFSKGNFSIKLNNLRKSDPGIYTCNFPNTIAPKTVHLKVIENRSANLLRADSLLLCLLGCILLSN